MFGRKKNKDEHVVTVSTKSELESAMKNKEPQIVVTGELAKKVKCLKKLSKASVAALIAGTAALGATVAIPPVGVVSLAATAGGASAPAIIAASGLALGIVLGVLKGYTIEVEGDKIRLIAK